MVVAVGACMGTGGGRGMFNLVNPQKDHKRHTSAYLGKHAETSLKQHSSCRLNEEPNNQCRDIGDTEQSNLKT